MIKPIVFRMFVTEAGSRSGKPGETTTQLRLNLRPKEKDQVDDPNAEVFPDDTKKSGSFECQGISAEAIAEIVGGRTAKVTIEFE